MNKFYLLTIFTLSFFFNTSLIAQIDVLKLFQLNKNLISEDGFSIVKDDGKKIKIEKDLDNSYFNKVVIEIKDSLAIINLYNTSPKKSELKEIADFLFNEYGKDSNGNKGYSKKDLEMFDYGIVTHRVWNINDETTLMLNYQDKVQVLKDYGGIVCAIYNKNNHIKYSEIKNKNTKNSLEEEFSFRKTKWGMSKQDVIKVEGESTEKSEDHLIYDNQLIGGEYNSQIAYIFIGNKLVRSKYLMNEKHSNKNDYVTDFLKVTKLLEKKYGQPLEKEMNWKNDLYKGDTTNYGLAVSIGHLTIYYTWRTSSTDIAAYISGDNYEILSQIEYKSRLMSDLEKKAKEKKALGDF